MHNIETRLFSSVKEMDETIIDNWNSLIKKNDIVYHAGDFALASKTYTKNILSQLNGNIYLCKGSHDKSALKCAYLFTDIQESYFISVNGQDIFISHHCHKVWPKSHYGAWHLHGHSHGGLEKYARNEGKILDVGVDLNNFFPIDFKQACNIMKDRPDNFNLLKK